MRILLTSPTYPPFNSGLGNAVSVQAACLVQAGHEVVVATGGAERSTNQVEGTRVETFAVTGADCWHQPIKGDVARYTAFLLGSDWDVVLMNAWQNWATDVALRHLEEIPGCKFVYSHCISTNVFYPHQPLRSVLRYLAWRPYWWRLAGIMQRLDGVLFLAAGGSDTRFDDLRLARKYAVPMRIVQNSISPAAMSVLHSPQLSTTARDRLIAVGSFRWQKGFDFVLRAYAASQANNKFALHLYGQEHSAYSVTLRALARRLGLREGTVVFHAGATGEELMAAYCQALLCLSGSHTECQPLALLDANAAGTPFVARTTGCIATMPGGAAVCSWREMAHEVDDLLGGGPRWQSLADAGRQAAMNFYHPSRTAKLLLDALTAKDSRTFRNH